MALEFTPSDLEASFRRLRTELDRRVTEKHAQEVTVTFLAADTDQDVPHSLSVGDPENLRYEVLRKSQACDVYDNQGAGRRVWTKSYITLRCTQTATVVLRISAR